MTIVALMYSEVVERSILAIIPARGGSKGIPRKNVRLLCGKPLIAYTIEAGSGSKVLTLGTSARGAIMC